MVVEIDGKRTAKFMFFNGISRSTKAGEIAYLSNSNRKQNLAFSFQMQAVTGAYYPGLTRKIYIKQYRYNMHFRERSLLIELGDENNTLEEAMNACYPLAHALDEVLSGNWQSVAGTQP
jgi:stage II sporulation protein P